MPTDELHGSVNSIFLDFSYASKSEHDFNTTKSTRARPLTENVLNRANTTVATDTRASAGDDKDPCLQIRKRKANGYDYHKVNTNLNHVHLQLNTIPKDVNQDFIFCKSGVKGAIPITTRATQTLYRESSAQTLPYLPDVKNNLEKLKYLELFKLAEIMPGEGPPGLYEVEILERARRRWAFADVVKEHLRNDIEAVRNRLCQGKYKMILEHFAFEQWIEREEYIMECQMIRFEIVVRMFNQREKELQELSKKAMKHEYMKILAKRDAALLKNDIEFSRDLRRLDHMRSKNTRNWRDWKKEHMSRQLGDPDSLYNAPQMRLGVNPNRRHYKPPCGNVFSWNIPLDPNYIDLNKLECPFTKLSKWSQPKKPTQEIETNFLSDENLQKIYETLKSLRLQLVKHKVKPKCLQKRDVAVKYHIPIDLESVNEEEDAKHDSAAYDVKRSTKGEIRFQSISSKNPSTSKPSRRFTQKYAGFAALMRQEKHIKRVNFIDNRREEIECLLAGYEGKNIGWIMRFLGEELQRLQELKKLHMITILTQRERWRREAAEAGMRQKENEMRQLFEELFSNMDSASSDVCLQYFNDIIKQDIHDFSNYEAEKQVTQLASQIDDDLQRWMEGIFCVQQPSTYDFLRYLLKELAFPNFEKIFQITASKNIVEYIFNEVLLPKVYKDLEPFDISFEISNSIIDRLIDDDLFYYTSDDCINDESCEKTSEVPEEVEESKALLRKLIRRAVPGRRWKTSTERIAHENFMDIIDNAFDAIDHTGSSIDSSETLRMKHSMFDLSHHLIYSPESGTSLHPSEKPSKKLYYGDISVSGDLRSICSTHDIHKYFSQKFRSSLSTTYTSSEVYCGSWNPLMESRTVVYKLISDLLSEIIIEDEPTGRIFQEENVDESTTIESGLGIKSTSDWTSMNTVEEAKIPGDDYVLQITESEFIRLTDESCKCEKEKLQGLELLRLIVLGKVFIIRRTESEIEIMSSGSKNIELNKDEISEYEQEIPKERRQFTDKTADNGIQEEYEEYVDIKEEVFDQSLL